MSIPRIRDQAADFDKPPALNDNEVAQITQNLAAERAALGITDGKYSILLAAVEYCRRWRVDPRMEQDQRDALTRRIDELTSRAARDVAGVFLADPSAFTVGPGPDPVGGLVPPTAGKMVGEVLTILAGGAYGWSTIGEAQIAAAVAQYLIDNPPQGVTQQQLTAEVTRLVGLINTNARAISSNDDDIQTNASAIAANLASIATERGRVSANAAAIAANQVAIAANKTAADQVARAIPPLQGAVAISPRNIPNAAAVQRDFKFAWYGLPEAWLKAQGANELDIQAKTFSFHAVDPWVPTAAGVIDVNVNAIEAEGIDIQAGETIIPILAVIRADGQYVADWETILEVIELPTTDAPTQAQFNAAIAAQNAARAALTTRSDAGDEIGVEEIGTPQELIRFFGSQETSDNAGWAFFTDDVTEVHDSVRHTFKARDLAYYAPRSILGKVIVNLPPVVTPFSFSTDDKLEMLNIRVDPGVIAYPAGGLAAALTRTVRVLVDNPGRLDEQLWVQGTIDGQAVLARRAWTTATVSLPFVIPIATARLIGQDEELDIVLQWYDAANAGNLVGSRRVDLPLVEQTALIEYANAAAAAAATVDANAIQWWPAS